MIVVIVPKGRGNWKRVTLVIHTPGLLLEVREKELTIGEELFLADRWWRIVELAP